MIKLIIWDTAVEDIAVRIPVHMAAGHKAAAAAEEDKDILRDIQAVGQEQDSRRRDKPDIHRVAVAEPAAGSTDCIRPASLEQRRPE